MKKAKRKNSRLLYCSFCGKEHREVRYLVTDRDGNVFICNECVEICEMLGNPAPKVTLLRNGGVRVDLDARRCP
jgi:hypothetical protein